MKEIIAKAKAIAPLYVEEWPETQEPPFIVFRYISETPYTKMCGKQSKSWSRISMVAFGKTSKSCIDLSEQIKDLDPDPRFAGFGPVLKDSESGNFERSVDFKVY